MTLFRLVLLLTFFLSASITNKTRAQISTLRTTFGGSDIEGDPYIKATSDGGSIIVGMTYSSNSGTFSGLTNHGPASSYDIAVIKLNSQGNIQWKKMIGSSDDNYIFAVDETYNGFVVCASTYSTMDGDLTGKTSNGDWDVWMIKLGFAGDILWQKLYEGSKFDEAFSFSCTKDSGMIVAAYSRSSNTGTLTGFTNHSTFGHDLWLFKLDSLGNLEWQKLYGSTGLDIVYKVIQTSDTGYLNIGYTSGTADGDLAGTTDYGGADIWVVKTNKLGVIEWQKRFGGIGADRAYSVVQLDVGGFLISGYTESGSTGTWTSLTTFGGTSDAFVMRLDASGNLLWQKFLGGNQDEIITSILPLPDGNYLLTGHSLSSNNGSLTGVTSNGGYDVWMQKIDIAGNLLWSKLVGSTGTEVSYSASLLSNRTPIIASNHSGTMDNDLNGLTSYGSSDWFVFTTTPINGLLPVLFDGFTSKCNSQQVVLNWSTASETNTSKFDVQKRVNEDWITIGTVQAVGFSNTRKEYTFTDRNSGVTAYRLRVIDKDGSSTYSSVVNSNCAMQNVSTIAVYPNPAKEKLIVEVTVKNSGTYTLKITDAQGRMVIQKPLSLAYGFNKVSSDVSGLTNGIYSVSIVGDGLMESQSLLIVK